MSNHPQSTKLAFQDEKIEQPSSPQRNALRNQSRNAHLPPRPPHISGSNLADPKPQNPGRHKAEATATIDNSQSYSNGPSTPQMTLPPKPRKVNRTVQSSEVQHDNTQQTTHTNGFALSPQLHISTSTSQRPNIDATNTQKHPIPKSTRSLNAPAPDSLSHPVMSSLSNNHSTKQPTSSGVQSQFQFQPQFQSQTQTKSSNVPSTGFSPRVETRPQMQSKLPPRPQPSLSQSSNLSGIPKAPSRRFPPTIPQTTASSQHSKILPEGPSQSHQHQSYHSPQYHSSVLQKDPVSTHTNTPLNNSHPTTSVQSILQHQVLTSRTATSVSNNLTPKHHFLFPSEAQTASSQPQSLERKNASELPKKNHSNVFSTPNGLVTRQEYIHHEVVSSNSPLFAKAGFISDIPQVIAPSPLFDSFEGDIPFENPGYKDFPATSVITESYLPPVIPRKLALFDEEMCETIEREENKAASERRKASVFGAFLAFSAVSLTCVILFLKKSKIAQ